MRSLIVSIFCACLIRMALARRNVRKRNMKHLIALPKFCQFSTLALLSAISLSLVSLLALFIESLYSDEDRLTDICIDYSTTALTMLLLLIVARKTAKDLLLSNHLECAGVTVTEQTSHLKASKRNMYQEHEFSVGSFHESNHEYLNTLTNTMRAEDYEK